MARSKIVMASYGLDVIVLVAFGLISYGFNKLTPHYHPFSILDLTISYPFKADTVSDLNLDLVSILAPALIIVIVSLVFIPAPSIAKRFQRGTLWDRKLWELATGWLGLALCHTTQIMIVTGLKNLICKPRPDMLARCVPDVANLEQYIIGGYGNSDLSGLVLVNQSICTQPNIGYLNDGFRSFPSGHSSTSWAGMLYLALWLSAKFGIFVPLFAIITPQRRPRDTILNRRANRAEPFTTYRDEAAAAPLYLLFLPYIPLAVAFFIAASRYFDYRHHGFDILSGSFIGILAAVFAFRFYHFGLGGRGWAWGPRSRGSAFGMGVGRSGFVDDGEDEEVVRKGDLESGVEGRQDGALLHGGSTS